MIGISEDVNVLTSADVALGSGGNNRAEETTKYDFTFRTVHKLQTGDYMRFTFQKMQGSL